MHPLVRAAPVLALATALVATAARVLPAADDAVARGAFAREPSGRATCAVALATLTTNATPATVTSCAPVSVAVVTTVAAVASAAATDAPPRRTLHAGGRCCEATISPVTAALRWLARHQDGDGGWSATRPACGCVGEGYASREAVTAPALLAFTRVGYTRLTRATYDDPLTRRRTSFGKVLKAGLAWLLARQDASGRIGVTLEDHAAATWVLVEMQAHAPDDALLASARRALDVLVRAGPARRPWPAFGADDLAAIRAIKLAPHAGIFVPVEPLGDIVAWLDAGPSQPFGAWLLCKGLLDHDPYLPPSPAQDLAAALPTPRWAAPDVHAWEVSASAVWGRPGEASTAWLLALRRALNEHQALPASGCADGSWDPAGDRAGLAGGRVVMTALAALSLTRAYQREALPDEARR